MTKTILILAANPRQDLDLRREVHILKSVIQRSQAQDEFEVKIDSGINADKIQKLFLEHKPRIVHFCGHGAGEDGLRFEDKLVSNDALSDLFKHFSNQIECVLLNSCYSDVQATEIAHHINYVIGMKQAIRDDSAIVFTRGFYETLGYQQSIEDSYYLGCNAIELQIDRVNDSSLETSKIERNAYTPKRASTSRAEYLKPQLKIKSPLTQFDDENKSIPSKDLPDVTKLVDEEIKRQQYRENINNNFDLGRNHINRELTRQEYRRKEVLLSKVKEFWIQGVLEKSLFNQVLFEQELIEKPDAVNRPFSEFEEFAVESDRSFEFTQASDIFEGMGAGRTLLILGEPGTGKTVSLVKLAERLVKKTEEDLTLPIPVVFNLSSWAIKRQNIADWLVEELKDKYGVSKVLAKQWIEQEDLILLLDGLDEVKKEYRNDCVRALNKFLREHGITETVVCCRVQDYEVLSERLNLRNAICIQPLSSEYINWYLDDVNYQVKDPSKSLVGLKQLLQRDNELEEFAKTPLIFSVMTVAYQGYCLEALLPEMTVKEKRYERLFDNYIEKMFARRTYIRSRYSKEDTKKWLFFLANKMGEKAIFYIEALEISWLFKNITNTQTFKNRELKNKLIGSFMGIMFGNVIAKSIIRSLILPENSLFQLFFLSLCYVVFIITGWFIGGLFKSSNQSQQTNIISDDIPEMSFERIPQEIPKWSCKRLFWALMVGMIGWLETIVVFSLAIGMFDLILFQSFFGIVGGFFMGIVGGFFKFLFMSVNSFLDQKIKIVDTLKWSWEKFRYSFANTFYISFFLKISRWIYFKHKRLYSQLFKPSTISYIIFTVATLILSIILMFFIPYFLQIFLFCIALLIPMSFIGLISAVINAVAPGAEIEKKTYPNQGIWNSFKNGNLGLLYGLIIGIVFIMPIGFVDEEMSSDIHLAVLGSLTWGLMAGSLISLSLGSKSFIQHIALRLILYFQGDGPLNYVDFLDYAKERIFMYKVGGGYIFIHRMLMEHFANMKLDKVSRQS